MNRFWTQSLCAITTTCVVGAISAFAFAQVTSRADVIVRIDTAKGVALVRGAHTGRVKAFRATAAELGAMKLGDAVKANWKTGSLSELKGVTMTTPLFEPDPIEPCCNVVAVVQDQAAGQALLGAIFGAEPPGDPAEPVNKPKINQAEPVNILSKKVRGIDAVKGIQANFHDELNGAEPVNGLIVVRDTVTGAFHALNASVLAENELGSVSAPITSSVRIGDSVSIDAAAGIAMIKNGSALYAFNLRGIKKTAEPLGTSAQWVVEPDGKAKGQFGIVRTIWHEKAISGHRSLYVYLPGEQEKHEYYELHKVEHSVLVGEYDMKVNGVLLGKVPVKPGHATRIVLGALHYTAAFSNQIAIHDAKGRLSLKMQGGETFGLPVGSYSVKVGTRTVNIQIKENQITEF